MTLVKIHVSYYHCHCFTYIIFLDIIINFGQSVYSYSENHGVVSNISIILSTAIAQSLTVTVSGGNNNYTTTVSYLVTLGPGTQPLTVEISGVDVNEAIRFTAHGAQSQGLPSFTIINDTVAMETIEQYNLTFHNPSITNGVILGFGTIIKIIDDDGKKIFIIFNSILLFYFISYQDKI